jgi:hypothetical protein
MHRLRSDKPNIRQTSRRLGMLAAGQIIIIALIYYILFYSYDYYNFLNYSFDAYQYRMALLSGIALTMITTTSAEADYTPQSMERQSG